VKSVIIIHPTEFCGSWSDSLNVKKSFSLFSSRLLILCIALSTVWAASTNGLNWGVSSFHGSPPYEATQPAPFANNSGNAPVS